MRPVLRVGDVWTRIRALARRAGPRLIAFLSLARAQADVWRFARMTSLLYVAMSRLCAPVSPILARSRGTSSEACRCTMQAPCTPRVSFWVTLRWSGRQMYRARQRSGSSRLQSKLAHRSWWRHAPRYALRSRLDDRVDRLLRDQSPAVAGWSRSVPGHRQGASGEPSMASRIGRAR